MMRALRGASGVWTSAARVVASTACPKKREDGAVGGMRAWTVIAHQPRQCCAPRVWNASEVRGRTGRSLPRRSKWEDCEAPRLQRREGRTKSAVLSNQIYALSTIQAMNHTAAVGAPASPVPIGPTTTNYDRRALGQTLWRPSASTPNTVDCRLRIPQDQRNI